MCLVTVVHVCGTPLLPCLAVAGMAVCLFDCVQMFMAVGLEDGRFAMYTPDKDYIRKRLQMKIAELGF
jgi:hypothetical protein